MLEDRWLNNEGWIGIVWDGDGRRHLENITLRTDRFKATVHCTDLEIGGGE